MAPRSFSTFAKRQKERARQEKQQAKMQRRQQRQSEREAGKPPEDAGMESAETPLAPTEGSQNES